MIASNGIIVVDRLLNNRTYTVEFDLGDDNLQFVNNSKSHVPTLRFRDGSNVQQIIEENEILNRYRNNIEVVNPGIVNGLSSTYVRQLLMEKQSIKYLVPEELRKYLEENEIYTAESQNTNKDTVLAPLKLYTTK